MLVYSNEHIYILFYVHAQICECLSVLCSYVEYIFEFVDVGKVWFSCPDDVIYKKTIPTISVWLQKVNSPWSNCDGLAPSLPSSALTFKNQYQEASANPYTHLFNFKFYLCASLGGKDIPF